MAALVPGHIEDRARGDVDGGGRRRPLAGAAHHGPGPAAAVPQHAAGLQDRSRPCRWASTS